MKKYQCLILDDEPIAQRILETYLLDQDRVHLAFTAYNTAEGRQYCSEHPVDLLLLDIQMPGETGLDFLRGLEKRPVTILTTAYLDYTLQGFELGVLDYLVKPIRAERFHLALQRAIEFLDLLSLQATLQPALHSQASVVLHSGSKRITLPVAEITHVQALKDYAIIHTGVRRHVVRCTMKNLDELLAPFGFVRVHKSFIVAKDKFDLICRNKIEFDGFQIPLGRRFKPQNGA